MGQRPSRRVLVCDDERHILRLVQVNLERQGYEVAIAVDGRTALHELKRRPFDILVIDADLVAPTTQEVLDAISVLPAAERVQVILLQKPKDEDRPQGPGGTGPIGPLPRSPDGPPPLVLAKPFNPLDLAALFE